MSPSFEGRQHDLRHEAVANDDSVPVLDPGMAFNSLSRSTRQSDPQIGDIASSLQEEQRGKGLGQTGGSGNVPARDGNRPRYLRWR
jgi:hypothetical protein